MAGGVCAFPRCECATRCPGVDEHDDWRDDVVGRCPQPCCTTPAPAAPSLVAGAIGRGLTDAQTAYRDELADLWRGVVEALPDD